MFPNFFHLLSHNTSSYNNNSYNKPLLGNKYKTTNQPNNKTTNQPKNKTTNQPNNITTNQPNNITNQNTTISQPNNTTISQPNNTNNQQKKLIDNIHVDYINKLIKKCDDDVQNLVSKLINYESEDILEKCIIDSDFKYLLGLKKYEKNKDYKTIHDMLNYEIMKIFDSENIINIDNKIKPLLLLIFQKIFDQINIIFPKHFGIKTYFYNRIKDMNYLDLYIEYIKDNLDNINNDIFKYIKYFKYLKYSETKIQKYLTLVLKIIIESKIFNNILKNNFDFIDKIIDCLIIEIEIESINIPFILYKIYAGYYNLLKNSEINISDLPYKKIYLLNELYNKKLDAKLDCKLIGSGTKFYLRNIKYIINSLYILKIHNIQNNINTLDFETDKIYFKILDDPSYYKEHSKYSDLLPSISELKFIDLL